MLGFLVVACLIGLVIFPPLYRSESMREAFRLTVSTPAMLVPAAFSLVVALCYRAFGRGVTEHPWFSSDAPAALGCSLLMAVAVAGQIGLLRAHVEGRQGGSADFMRGIRDHVAAIFLGKLLLMLGTTAVQGLIGARGASSVLQVLCLVPNVLLGGLVGTCAQKPGAIFSPITTALRKGARETSGLARIVLAQTIALAAIAWVVSLGAFPYRLLGLHANVLSHSPFPVLVSSACITATFLRVRAATLAALAGASGQR